MRGVACVVGICLLAGCDSEEQFKVCMQGACGGDPTGRWRAGEQSCGKLEMPGTEVFDGCDGLEQEWRIVPTGIMELEAGHMDYDITLSLDYHVKVPKTCEVVLAVGADCERLGDALGAALDVVPLQCRGSGFDSSCTCDGNLDWPAGLSAVDFDYTVESGRIVPAGQPTEDGRPYCVDGDLLAMWCPGGPQGFPFLLERIP